MKFVANFNWALDIFYGGPRFTPSRGFDELSRLVLRTRTGCPVSRSIYQARQFTKEPPWSSSQSTEVVDRTCGHPENGVSWSRPSVSTNLWHVIKKSSVYDKAVSPRISRFVSRKLSANSDTEPVEPQSTLRNPSAPSIAKLRHFDEDYTVKNLAYKY